MVSLQGFSNSLNYRNKGGFFLEGCPGCPRPVLVCFPNPKRSERNRERCGFVSSCTKIRNEVAGTKLFSFSPEQKTMNPFTVVYTKEKWGVALRSLFKLQKTHVHTHSYKYRGALFLNHPFLSSRQFINQKIRACVHYITRNSLQETCLFSKYPFFL